LQVKFNVGPNPTQIYEALNVGDSKAGVNFINILCAHFAPIFWLQKIQSCVLGLKFFWCQNNSKKSASKMLMQLIPGGGGYHHLKKKLLLLKPSGINFIDILAESTNAPAVIILRHSVSPTNYTKL